MTVVNGVSKELRTLLELLLMFAACLAASWALDFYISSRPATVSGVVIDWRTGRPAPDTDVRKDQPNFSSIVARTDSQGRFTYHPRLTPTIEFLFAGQPRYGKLLQTTFGQRVYLNRAGAQVANVVIPAIPAVELSGHVYTSNGRPLSGCYISVLTRDTHPSGWKNLQRQEWSSTMSFTMAKDDDPQKFLEITWSSTDAEGGFSFEGLGADRYFVLARCNSPGATARTDNMAWTPMVYPNAYSIADAHEIVLLPGDKKDGIDFYLRQEKSYHLTGKLIFSDHSAPKPWPRAIYSQNLYVVRSDRSLTSSSSIAEEPCQINANAGTFWCDGLLPGEYTFYFQIEPATGASRHIAPQAAKAIYTVPNGGGQPFIVQMQDLPNFGWHLRKPYSGPAGVLDLKKTCDSLSSRQREIQILASGHGYAKTSCDYGYTAPALNLPKDRYRVEAFEPAFLVHGESAYFGHRSKFLSVLGQRGTVVDLAVGQKVDLALPVLTTWQLIDIGMHALRAEPQKH